MTQPPVSRRIRLAYALTIFFFFIAYARFGIGTPQCFGDCSQYLYWTDATGLDQWIARWKDAQRPFPIPLAYSFFGPHSMESALNIVQFQTLFSFANWLVFAWASSSILRSPWLRFAGFAVLSSAMFGRGIGSFNLDLSSDSLSMSFQLLFLSLLFKPNILDQRMRSPAIWIRYGALFGFLCLGSLAIFARDTNAIFLLPILLLSSGFLARARLWPSSMACLLCAGICVGSLQVSAFTERGMFNTRNVFAARVFGSNEAMNFMRERHGFNPSPIDAASIKALSALWGRNELGVDPASVAPDGALRQANYALIRPMGEFALSARGAYAEWMIRHPIDHAALLWRNRSALLDSRFDRPSSVADMKGAFGPCDGCYPPLRLPSPPDISPIDHLSSDACLIALLACISCYCALAIRKRSTGANPSSLLHASPLAIAIAISIAGLLCSSAAFLGDYWEAGETLRHAMAGSVFFRLGLLCSVLMLADMLLSRRASRS